MAGTQAKRSSLEYASGRVGPRTATKTRARVRRHLLVQIVDDSVGRTLASASTLDATIKTAEGDKTAKAKLVGALIAERAKDAGIEAVVFDRGGFQYHGRVAALADSAREAGLTL